MSFSRLRVLTLAVLLFLVGAPARLVAQEAAPRTYTVKRGDTLWDIARALLGDAYQWPEIYRLNKSTIENPHWIYPGEVLNIGGAAAPAPASGGKGTTASRAVNKPAASSPVAAPAREIAAAPTEAPRMPTAGRARSTLGGTVFRPVTAAGAVQERAALILRERVTAVRPGEYAASPYMWAAGGPKDAGRLARSAESQGIDLTLENRPVQVREPVFVKLPRDMSGQPGDRLLVYRLGNVVDGQGQVIIPTGIVRLISAPKDGYAQGTVMQQFEDVFTGQSVTRLDTLSMPRGVFPRAVEGGRSSPISWIYSDPVLPTTGHYFIIAATAKDGLQPGDQLSLRRSHDAEREGRVRADEEVAVAQVTRVTLWGASAIVISQQQVGIIDGMRATVTARMP